MHIERKQPEGTGAPHTATKLWLCCSDRDPSASREESKGMGTGSPQRYLAGG